MENKAERENEGKLRWSLVDFKAMSPMVKVLEFGAEKYDDDNWSKGLGVKGICESLLRHTFALLSGETNDPESGLPHIGHIQCNAMFIAHMMKFKPEFDDRRKEEFYESTEPVDGPTTEFNTLPPSETLNLSYLKQYDRVAYDVIVKTLEGLKIRNNACVSDLQ